jgi:hypothetical protein
MVSIDKTTAVGPTEQFCTGIDITRDRISIDFPGGPSNSIVEPCSDQLIKQIVKAIRSFYGKF